MKVVGLTGGIASGKSTVARLLEQLGASIIDADQVAREVVHPGEEAFQKIVNQFGKGILTADGNIDRKALGRIVFADRQRLRELERITHPAIRDRVEQKLELLKNSGRTIVFYVAPILIEAGNTSMVQEIWVVYIDPPTQMERLINRDGLSSGEAEQRIAAQMPMEEKRKLGKIVIDNSSSFEETERQVREAWAKLCAEVDGQ